MSFSCDDDKPLEEALLQGAGGKERRIGGKVLIEGELAVVVGKRNLGGAWPA